MPVISCPPPARLRSTEPKDSVYPESVFVRARVKGRRGWDAEGRGENPRLREGGAKTQTSNTLRKALSSTDATQRSVMLHKLGIKKRKGRGGGDFPSVTKFVLCCEKQRQQRLRTQSDFY